MGYYRIKTDDFGYKTTIGFDYTPAEPQTFTYPGCPEDLEVTDIDIMGHATPDSMFNALIGAYKDEYEEVCWEHVRGEKSRSAEDAVCEAEHRRDWKEDR